MSHSKKYYLPVVTFLFFGVLATQIWAQRILDADESTCAIYQAFYDQLPDKEIIYLSKMSVSYDHFPSESVPTAPSKFEKDTGAFEDVEILPGDKPFKVPVRESFIRDTAEYFSAVMLGESRRISGCFKGRYELPQFWSGQFDELHSRVYNRGTDWQGFISLWTVSPVGFSSDGDFAIMEASLNCGWLCGWGGFILFEKEQDEWVVAGDKWLWVS